MVVFVDMSLMFVMGRPFSSVNELIFRLSSRTLAANFLSAANVAGTKTRFGFTDFLSFGLRKM
jgi:hypothetical protein